VHQQAKHREKQRETQGAPAGKTPRKAEGNTRCTSGQNIAKGRGKHTDHQSAKHNGENRAGQDKQAQSQKAR